MTDREKLIKLLGGDMCKDVCCYDCEYEDNDRRCIEHIKQNMADHLLANGVTFQKWIPVTERLPEKTDYYLYKAKGRYRGLKDGVGVSYFMHKANKWQKTNGDFVTHWMPLPEAPKE